MNRLARQATISCRNPKLSSFWFPPLCYRICFRIGWFHDLRSKDETWRDNFSGERFVRTNAHDGSAPSQVREGLPWPRVLVLVKNETIGSEPGTAIETFAIVLTTDTSCSSYV